MKRKVSRSNTKGEKPGKRRAAITAGKIIRAAAGDDSDQLLLVEGEAEDHPGGGKTMKRRRNPARVSEEELRKTRELTIRVFRKAYEAHRSNAAK